MRQYILKAICLITPIRAWRKKMRTKAREIGEENFHNKMLNKYWGKDVRILSGPFKGMRYITQSNGSVFFPKLIGCYEENLHPWLNEIKKQKYEVILDIGCAEGYYAAGFAYNNYAQTVYAYDIDDIARKNAIELIAINGLSDRVFVRGLCTYEEIEKTTKDKKALVFCDIEGAEDLLLNPETIPALKNIDFIIETHDSLSKGVTDRLIERFQLTHRIQIESEHDINYNAYPIFDSMSVKLRKQLSSEKRILGMVWLKLTVR
ncbi:MAG: 50S ribosomal protein L11 methyltransferase [Opitutaceae bacterium]|jgi:SAM-dependent methyltransferase|nr:50S ribosomal protein L11 methyltransferase [Opitutaceae bacterium]